MTSLPSRNIWIPSVLSLFGLDTKFYLSEKIIHLFKKAGWIMEKGLVLGFDKSLYACIYVRQLLVVVVQNIL